MLAQKHFEEQKIFAEQYLVPLLKKQIKEFTEAKILEVGCAEAGFLAYLQDIGLNAAGIELAPHRVKMGLNFNPSLNIQVGDITDINLIQRIPHKYNLIVMRDVIEHISKRQETFQILWELLRPGGYLYITFPPRFSAFAGHQQHARSFLKWTPFVHFLPECYWYWLGKKLRETPEYLDSVMFNYRTGLTIHKFEKLYTHTGFQAVLKDLFLFRPIFKFRMGLPIIKLPNIFLLREFFATGCEYLLKKI